MYVPYYKIWQVLRKRWVCSLYFVCVCVFRHLYVIISRTILALFLGLME